MATGEDKREELDRAFFDTDDPELRAFAQRNTGRKVLALVLIIVGVLAAGAIVGWAMVSGLR